ncbi:PAAR-like domain-containing protein [Psychrobacter urativorans]|uniref:PAAR-like domain-containing protein n=1 Tax=Psychrobacter urativorans TaxID=45610 RepID=UPI00191B4387|nr:PAAR-like domain-containing protein [Psychrobacter urativorans]
MSEPAVTVHIASMGTKLAEGGESAVGHMWYELHDSKGNSSSYGFAPIEHGQAFGPGRVYKNDTSNYLDRAHMRTFEISQAQFNKMQVFGEDPNGSRGRRSRNDAAGVRGEYFDEKYNGIDNSCIDFTWEGLAQAGLKPKVFGMTLPGANYDGTVWPINNVLPVNMIDGKEIPYPGKIDYMKKKGTTWKDGRKDASSQLGGSQQANLMAISVAPSFNYTSHKKDAVAAYTLFQMLDNAVDTVSTVSFNGQPAYVLAQTTQPTCKGDESGIGGGVKSGTVGKEVKPTSGSSGVFVAGKALIREADTCTMNNANTTGKYILV